MRVYFKNLDGLRFIAAFMVILQHTADYKSFAVPQYSNIFYSHFKHLGGYGVTLFFVLSGFLISYLLFAEKEKTTTINIRHFYIRRVLRIWPLYLLYGILITLLVPFVLRYLGVETGQYTLTNLLYLLTFTINFQLIFATFNRGIVEILWSVCIEEQFYAIWPWVVRKFYSHLKAVAFTFIAIGIVTTIVLYKLVQYNILNTHVNPVSFFPLSRFAHFGIGILSAYYYFKHKAQTQAVVNNRMLQAFAVMATLFVVLHIITLPAFVTTYLFDVVPAVLFAFIILAAISGNFIFNFEYGWFKLLGTYSYGIYILHPSIAQIMIAVFKKWVPNGFVTYELLYPLSVTLLTVAAAAISYEVYEKRFLLLKNKFTHIQNKTVLPLREKVYYKTRGFEKV